MKTLESFFSRTAQFGLLIYLTGCFGLLIVLGAAVAKWLKLIDVIQYIAFAFGLGCTDRWRTRKETSHSGVWQ